MHMSEHAIATDDETMKFGLLMESAQVHQRLAEAHLDKLRVHTQDLDGIVRDEIRRTLIAELQSVTVETERAARALRDMKRRVHVRGIAWNIGAAVLCTSIPTTVAHWTLPSASQIAALREQRDVLTASLARLERQGAKAEWRNCGDSRRLCVRVDLKAPVYGDKADFFVVKGY
jgi:hypothetical protein